MESFPFGKLYGRLVVLPGNDAQVGYGMVVRPKSEAQHIQAHRIGFSIAAEEAFAFGTCVKNTIPIEEKGLYPGGFGYEPGIGRKKYPACVFKYLLYIHF